MDLTEFAKTMTAATPAQDVLLAAGQATEVSDGGALTVLYGAIGGSAKALCDALRALRTDHPEVHAWATANTERCFDPERRTAYQLAGFACALEWAAHHPDSVRQCLERQAQNVRDRE